ncbi:hypothetical protein RirG_121060 [Rhizophagus irregularis DAOM 197198w]|uniref:Uncharacterized protein n=1 Tax=Rhizophagus irregularis (strain DAOM 197198w) TaxID=1432141 RepID=A0A015L2V7_RHIIW|nr:hypothetical protein RirG_121060 [Rhizophagus irregularis DAOM 197198w]
MAKMIMHWKSNAKKKLDFYGIEKNDTCISETEMNIRIAEALAETNDDDDECDVLLNESLPNQITIPPDNYESEEEYEKINTDDGNDDEQESEQESDGKGNFDYNVENLLNEFIDVDDIDEE